MDFTFRANNHFVPELILKQFSYDDIHVREYSFLVEDERVPRWRPVALKKLAKRRHLYTEVGSTDEHDELERWFESEFETPAASSVSLVLQGAQLTTEELRPLIRLLALQDMRTPASFLKSQRSWTQRMPEMANAVQQVLSGNHPDGNVSESTLKEIHKFYEHFGLGSSLDKMPSLQEEKVRFNLRIAFSRRAWLADIRSALRDGPPMHNLLRNDWTILRAAPSCSFLTSDTPVQKLIRQSDCWRTGGGWSSDDSIIFMPLSTRHMLYTQIGLKAPTQGTTLTEVETEAFNNALVKTAYESIFSHVEDATVQNLRPRVVDRETFQQRRKAWDDWHKVHSDADRGL